MEKNSLPNWLHNAIFYQIYPQSFYDSNGDGIGDIPGIIEKLDYIEWLGITALWLNPCFVSPFQDAGYDVADYYRAALRYGTNEDLKRLFEAAHQRNIKVCLDLVPGHTSIEHPWFKASCRHDRNKYSDRYIWTHSTWDHVDDPLKFIQGYAERDGAYGTNFFYCQPALNYGYANPKYPWQQPVDAPGPQAMRKELRNIMAFWLDLGCDGFRVDMAASLVKNDPGKKETKKLWREVRQWLNTNHPDAVLIAEWGNPGEAIDAGFHIDFMLHFNTPGYPSLFFNEKGVLPGKDCYFDLRGKGTVTEFLAEFLNQKQGSANGFIAIPSSNHDFHRPSVGRTDQELKVIFTFLLTWQSVPFIYYGDEIGMRYLFRLPSKEGGYWRTGSRTPMQWDNRRNAGFSAASPKQLYLPIDLDENRPTVHNQQADPDSLLNHIHQLILLRKKYPAFQADARLKILFAEQFQYPFVYLRKKGADRFLVAINPSGREATASFRLSDATKGQKIFGDDVHITAKNDELNLRMGKISSVVIKV